ncbi:MAG: DegV family protein [Lachnospiraceae bacterium]|jgi:DegV family protein with EDD domain
MRNFVIFGDSTCDLDRELREKYSVDYIPMNYVLDGKEYPASLDWEFLSAKDFYNEMRGGKRITTTQVPGESFEKRFEENLAAGRDVLYIGCSSALSGSVNQSLIIAKELMEKYPEGKIRCMDARNSSFGQGIQIIWASEMRAEGKGVDEVADYLEANRLKVHQIGTVENLSYLKRAGRVTASSAFFGNLIGIKPILISDAKGQNYAVKKVKGAQAAREELIGMIQEEIRNPEEQCIYIAHADVPEAAEEMKALIQEKVKCKEVVIGYIGPIVGASVGPGTVAIYFVGEEVTIVGEA